MIIKLRIITYIILILILYFCCVTVAVSGIPVRLIHNNDNFKVSTKIQIIENGHVTLVCPEFDKESHVQWFKDYALLNSSFRNNMGYGEEEPHLTIDGYNSLYVLHATRQEEGTYICKVDGENIQKWCVEIVSKSRLLNEDFIRFSIYLGFVLSLTLTCYCAGICLAWHRRASFADPLNLYNPKPKK